MAYPISIIEKHFSRGYGEIAKIDEVAKDRYLVARIDQDDLAETPRQFFEDCPGIFLLHPNYDHIAGENDITIDLDIELGDHPTEHFENIKRKQLKLRNSELVAYAVISSYNHSGTYLSLGYKTGFDYGVIGFAVLTKSHIRELYGCKRVADKYVQKAIDDIKANLNDITAWINGDCYKACLDLVTVKNDKVALLDNYDYIDQDCNLFDRSLALECATELFDKHYSEVCLEQEQCA